MGNIERTSSGRPAVERVGGVAMDQPKPAASGEKTAAVAFGAMLRALPGDAAIYGVVEVGAPADRLPLPRSAQLE
jgi:Siderophore-interacting protein